METHIYFDTNIYSFVKSCNELHSMHKMLKAYNCKLTASSGNLFEVYAIPSPEEARSELKVITFLADNFEQKPQSWYHAYEFRNEIRRLRPQWIKPIVFNKQIRHCLSGHKELWTTAKCLKLPPSHTYKQYRKDAEQGISNHRYFQKMFRTKRIHQYSQSSLYTPSGGVLPINTDDPEIFWRIEGLIVWYNAIEMLHPSSRDYADWLLPYINKGVFKDPSYDILWLSEIDSRKAPLNRLIGLISFYQLEHKISHGNAADQLHAGHWFSSDLFITADVAFYKVLSRVADVHYQDHSKPLLIDRSAGYCVDQVESLIRSYVGTK